ncbi:MAG: methyltransferase domain-containing protein [Alphaproteobacteria bacterium]|nr:methyltransferase domain-containing protein [Alphaproteobacteria bacterium]
MRILTFALAAFFAASATPALAADIPANIAAAVADKDRPKQDVDRDAARHPAEIMALTGIKEGDHVVDVGPGKGYYSRIMSRIVGANGKVYGFNPTWVDAKFPTETPAVKALAAAGYPNVEAVVQPMDEIKFDAPVDLVFISQIYHDQVWQKVDVAKMNKAIFDALKPGGVYFVIDHTGPGITTPEQIDKTHRIDPDVVKQQILAAGFKLEAESDILRNPDDPKNNLVFDPSIRGHTDQFIFKFVKPK